MGENSIVFVVDDDSAARDSVCALVESMGLNSAAFPSAEAFLAAGRPDMPSCIVADLSMEGMSGLDLQRKLAKEFGITPGAVSQWESGQRSIPGTVQRLVEIYEDGLA